MPVYKNPPDLKVEETESPELKIVKHYHAQCLSIKQEIYDLMAKMHKNLEAQSDEYVLKAKDARMELAELLVEANKVRKSMRAEIDNAKAIVHLEGQNLLNQRVREEKEFDLMVKRMGELESYLKNQRFYTLVQEINALEDKFEKEAMKLVQKRMGSKDL